ncbi:capsid decoration protein [Vibrio phage VCPH]|nr:capsid decoration protein [Vibrio phage VCPH]
MATRITFENLYATRNILLKASEAQKRLTITPNIGGSGVSNFLGLTDTPANYTGQKGKVAVVNTGETAIEFIDVNLLSPDVSGLQSDLDLAEGRIDNLETDLGTVENDLAGALARLAVNEALITSLQGFDVTRVDQLESDYTTLDAKVDQWVLDLTDAETDIQDLETDVGTLTAIDTNIYNALGVSKGNQNLGNFAGATISDNATVKGAIQQLELALEAIDTSGGGDANTTVIGTTEDHLGEFTGTVITDDQTIKAALQELETYSETLRGEYDTTDENLTKLAAAVGIALGATNLGEFTGNTIADNVSTKVALQTLETAVELLQTSGSTAEAIAVRKLTGTATNAEHLGQFNGTLITDDVTVKVALQELEDVAEKNKGDIELLDLEAMASRTLTGTLEGARDLGEFTGSTIADNSDIKQALAQLEAAVEGNGGTGGTEIVNIRTMTGTNTGDQNLGAFAGTTISNNNTIKGALQELEAAIENGGGGGGGGGETTLNDIQIIDTRFLTVASEQRYLFDADTAGGSLNVTLPAASLGDWFVIGFLSLAAHDIILNYGGQRIAGQETAFKLDKNNMVLRFEYVGGQIGWKIIDGVGEGGAGASAGTEIPAFQVMTSGFTVASGERYLCDVAGGAINAQLPAGTAGDWVTIGFYTTAANPINLVPDGSQNIMGLNESFVFDQNYMILTFDYVDDTIGWRISDGIGEGGSSGGSATNYRIKIFAAGALEANELLFLEPVQTAFTIPQSFSGSRCYANVANSSGGAETVLIKKNGADAAIITWANGANGATYLLNNDLEFEVGDIISVQAAGTLTIEDVSLTILGNL